MRARITTSEDLYQFNLRPELDAMPETPKCLYIRTDELEVQMKLADAVEEALEANDMEPSEEVREAGRVVATLQD